MIDEARAALLRRLAHDLRSPLGVLKGTLDEMSALRTPDEREHAVRRAERAVERLLRLADRLSMTGRASEGFAPVPQTIEVRAMVEAAIDAVLAAEPRSRVSCEVVGEARWPADPTLLRGVLEELLSNAFKNARTQVRVEVRDDLVMVEDDGAGIAPERVPGVFEEMYPTRQGLGLGLPLAAAEAEAMGMTISVSPRSGAGTLSVFTLRR
jgi:signal transduction histidine kinase